MIIWLNIIILMITTYTSIIIRIWLGIMKMWKLINRCIWIFQKVWLLVQQCQLLYLITTFLPKREKLLKKKIIFLIIKENDRQETRINNKSDKDHPTNKWKTIKRISNKERKDSPSLKRSINLNITYKIINHHNH